MCGGRAHLPPVTPCPLFRAASISLGLHAFSAHKGEAVTAESPWGHGSLPPSGSRRERESTNSKPAKQQPRSSAAGRSPRPGPPRQLMGREPSASRKRRLAAPEKGARAAEGWEGGFATAKEKLQIFLPFTHPPRPTRSASLAARGITSLPSRDFSPTAELGRSQAGCSSSGRSRAQKLETLPTFPASS